ncbi:MAG: YbjN domain-containing protein [Verrucomicrobia bacterium]|nr:YbjN domain-containing protein [Verrucomicrobiota bacterium]
MTHKAHLESLKEALQQKGYQCEMVDKAHPKLEVTLKGGGDTRIWKALLSPTSQKLGLRKESEKAHFLQLFLPFPYGCEAENVQNTARLLLLINKSLPFPAFGLSEVEGVIYYRHVLYCHHNTIPTMLVCTLLGALLLYVDSLSPMIELVSSGQKGLHEVLEEVLKSDFTSS